MTPAPAVDRSRSSDPNQAGWHGAERRKLFGRILSWMVDPWLDYIYFRFDLNGANGRPVHSKVVAFWVLVFVTVVTAVLWGHIFGGDATDPHRGTELTAATSLTIFLVFASFGLPGVKIWASSRAGAATGDIADTAKAEAAAAAAVIAARRATVADRSYEPSQ